MQLTTKGRYAVISVVTMAETNSPAPVNLKNLSEKISISLPYLEQIFSKLRKAGIVRSLKGPGGGYVLSVPASEITIAKIVQAVGEPIKMTRCKDGKTCIGCRCNGRKSSTHNLWKGLEQKISEYFSSISIEDVYKDRIKF